MILIAKGQGDAIFRPSFFSALYKSDILGKGKNYVEEADSPTFLFLRSPIQW
jgi:hypothetical protein